MSSVGTEREWGGKRIYGRCENELNDENWILIALVEGEKKTKASGGRGKCDLESLCHDYVLERRHVIFELWLAPSFRLRTAGCEAERRKKKNYSHGMAFMHELSAEPFIVYIGRKISSTRKHSFRDYSKSGRGKRSRFYFAFRKYFPVNISPPFTRAEKRERISP